MEDLFFFFFFLLGCYNDAHNSHCLFTLARVGFIFLGFGSSGAHIIVAPLEGCVPFLLLHALEVDTEDLVGVFFAASDERVVATSCSAVMLVMIPLKLLFTFSVLVALLMASSKVVSISSSSSVFDSSSIKIFSLPFAFGS